MNFMSKEQTVSIDLKEQMKENPREYGAVVKLIFQAVLDNSEEVRREARKTLISTFQEEGMQLQQMLNVDNGIVMTASYQGQQVSAYLCDQPKEYQGRPPVFRGFEVRKE